MYKKPFAVQGTNLLSKKDLKSLKTHLVEAFPALADKVLDELLPDGQVKVLKLDNRCLLYAAGDAAPSFFDAEGRGEIFPTLTTLWQHPYMMAELTIHAPVSKFVLNGADLMLPGVIVPANGVAGFGAVQKGQRRCIKIEGNPYPIAVGKMLVNQTQMEKLKGKGLEVCHVYKDSLWAFAGKPVPNAGFAEKDDEITPCSDTTYVHGAPPAANAAAAAPAEGGSGELSAAGADAGAPAAASAAPSAAGGPAKAPEEWTQDELLDFTFMQAFKLSLAEDKMLPVEASDLYEKHMKPRRPEGTTLDVKKSSHKQIGKFLNAMRKAKVIEVVEKKNVVSVTKVDRGHKLFAQLEEKYAGAAAEAKIAENAAVSTAGNGKAGLPPPTITTLWKPSHYLESLFKIMGKSKSDILPWDGAKDVLVGYIRKEGLGDGSEGSMVKLSEELITALLKAAGGQKQGTTFPEEVELSELEDKMQERMQEHTCIEVAGVGPTTRKGPPVKIEVSLSRKGAHNVTRACNLEAYGIDVQSMGDELKRKLNCTVHIEDMPGKTTKDKLLQLQGHVNNEIADYLFDKYGITKSFLSVK